MYKKLLIIGAIFAALAITLLARAEKAEASTFNGLGNPCQASSYYPSPCPQAVAYQQPAPFQSYAPMSQPVTPNYNNLYPYPTYQDYQSWYYSTHPAAGVTAYPSYNQPAQAYPSYQSYPTYQNYPSQASYPSYAAPTPNYNNLYPYPTYQDYQSWYYSTHPTSYGTYSSYSSYPAYNSYPVKNQNPVKSILTCAISQIICAQGQLYCTCNGYPYYY